MSAVDNRIKRSESNNLTSNQLTSNSELSTPRYSRPLNTITIHRSTNPARIYSPPTHERTNLKPTLSWTHPGKNYSTQTEFERANYKNYSSNPTSSSRFATAHTNVSAPRETPGDYREDPIVPTRTPTTDPTPGAEKEEESNLSGTAAGGIGYIANSVISGISKEAEIENNPTPGNSVGQGTTLNPSFYDSPEPQGLLNARQAEAKKSSEDINLASSIANVATGASIALL